jgi:hypothetical protein
MPPRIDQAAAAQADLQRLKDQMRGLINVAANRRELFDAARTITLMAIEALRAATPPVPPDPHNPQEPPSPGIGQVGRYRM